MKNNFIQYKDLMALTTCREIYKGSCDDTDREKEECYFKPDSKEFKSILEKIQKLNPMVQVFGPHSETKDIKAACKKQIKNKNDGNITAVALQKDPTHPPHSWINICFGNGQAITIFFTLDTFNESETNDKTLVKATHDGLTAIWTMFDILYSTGQDAWDTTYSLEEYKTVDKKDLGDFFLAFKTYFEKLMNDSVFKEKMDYKVDKIKSGIKYIDKYLSLIK